MKVASFVLLRCAIYYNSFKNIEEINLKSRGERIVGAFTSSIAPIWAKRENESLINEIRLFSIYNYIKALIDFNSTYLEDFDSYTGKFEKLNLRDFYFLDRNTTNTIENEEIKTRFKMVLEEKNIFIDFLSSNLLQDALSIFITNYNSDARAQDIIASFINNLTIWFNPMDIGVIGLCSLNKIIISDFHLTQERKTDNPKFKSKPEYFFS